MLQLKNIHKEYKLGDLNQVALEEISLDFRENEFISILGPSGSGKTTLLNVIGGLDQYDSGDLVINGVSTKNYKDHDWDAYRNHTVGFVFQSYNLIGHQTILANVELALTIAGISKEEKTKRAKEALDSVGLSDHINKKPNQLSGGQMQRVAIARALVNNPDILLADEPTGALDTKTSIQIMELLKKVAQEKLVVMVTHNPELAMEYSNRIIKLKDGVIVDDSNPFVSNGVVAETDARSTKKKAKMSIFTSFGLSLSNLNTKKKRTLLTAFAGSIGIIGIALILSLSNGVNAYIDDLQKDTLGSYPITISAESVDLTGGGGGPMIAQNSEEETQDTTDPGTINSDFSALEDAKNMTITNNLAPFKEYLDDPNSEIAQYLETDGVQYTYDTSFSVYGYDAKDNLINTDSDPSELTSGSSTSGRIDPMEMALSGGVSSSSSASNFSAVNPGSDGAIISETVSENYDIVSGTLPTAYNEILLVTDENGSVSAETLYQIGMISADEYSDYADLIADGNEAPALSYTYEEILNHELLLLSESDKYIETSNGTYSLVEDDALAINDDILAKGETLKITGIISPKADAVDANLSTSFVYTSLLSDHIIEDSNNSALILAQEATPDINVLTGVPFDAASDDQKIEDITAYLQNASISEKADIYSLMMYQSAQASGTSSAAAMGQSDEALAGMLDKWLVNSPDNDVLLNLYDEMLGGSYEENLNNFGKVDYASPDSVNIYTDTFEAKDGVVASIVNYNNNASEENKIEYTDYVESLTSAMTTMVDTISYVLIAFVAVSLIVSCIMVGIITHISVIERTKEIGILRALGASKSNISQVFNAETLIIGLCSGIIGIVATLLINIPVNAIIQGLLNDASVSASLPATSAVILLIISVGVTMIGGLLPAKKAAQKDPVVALRTE